MGVGVTPDQKKKWVEDHMSYVGQLLNKRRTYCAKQMKEGLFRFLESQENHGRVMPTPADIVRCAKRQLDLKVDYDDLGPAHNRTPADIYLHSKNWWLFYVYWEILLPKAMGREVYSPNMHHFFPISLVPFFHDGAH